MRHIVAVARDGRVLVFGEEWEGPAAVVFVELDEIECLRVVVGGGQHSCFSRDNGTVNNRVSVVIDVLAEVNGLPLGVVEVERHLEGFGFVAAA